jgi:hypothetical protein
MNGLRVFFVLLGSFSYHAIYKYNEPTLMRKTITERLTTKYQIIVRNEENFADKWALNINLAKVLVFLAITLLILFTLFFYVIRLINFIFSGNEQLEERKSLLLMMAKVDSLELKLEANDKLLSGWKVMMDGGMSTVSDSVRKKTVPLPAPEPDGADAEFVMAYEKEYGIKPYEDPNGFTRLYFFSPLKNGKFVEQRNEKAILESSKPESALALSSAIVLNVDSTSGILLLQHKEGLISRYSSLRGIVVKENQFVSEAQALTKPVNTTIEYSMWYRSRELRPADYIAFPR